MTTNLVRVRFAPSPTGPLHIGGLRTALFNYLFARQHKGTFILRIEDTDQNRFIPGAEDYIIESLKWIGINIDEGIIEGGPYVPYRQSERKEIYREYAEKLLTTGDAYYAFDTIDELEKIRKEYEARKVTFTYDASVRDRMNNSLFLTGEELTKKLNTGIPYVIRFRFKPDKEIVMHDIIRGEVKVQSSLLDDKVLFKSDGMPTYHLANVVDDHLMKITHVIRGEEWLPSLPLHVALYEAFGWKDTMPQFAHLPLILKPDGKGKLSKRDGDKGGFPVFPLEWKDPFSGEISSGYRESGYFPEACRNILALLGWNPGTEQEIFSMDELIKQFSIDKVGKSGAKFDPEKARWFNHYYIQKQSIEELGNSFKKILESKNISPDRFSPETINEIILLVKERANFIQDLWEHSDFFFISPSKYDEVVVKKYWKADTPSHLEEIINILSACEPFKSNVIDEKIKTFIHSKALGMGQIMNTLRIALVGSSKGPGLAVIAEILGKDEVIRRILKAIDTIKL